MLKREGAWTTRLTAIFEVTEFNAGIEDSDYIAQLHNGSSATSGSHSISSQHNSQRFHTMLWLICVMRKHINKDMSDLNRCKIRSSYTLVGKEYAKKYGLLYTSFVHLMYAKS